MNPIVVDRCNTVLRGGSPDVQDLAVERAIQNDLPLVRSFWKPSEEELRLLNDGGSVMLEIWGVTHSPLWIEAVPDKEKVDAG